VRWFAIVGRVSETPISCNETAGQRIPPIREVAIRSSAAKVKISAVQLPQGTDIDANLSRAAAAVRAAASGGANLVLLPEFFATGHPPLEDDSSWLELAEPAEASRIVAHQQALARETQVILPTSFYEKDGDRHFNSVAMIDRDGTVLGVYRKSHIPPGRADLRGEKLYFDVGDSGFKTFDTALGRLGLAICYDYMFPETARWLELAGADILLAPFATGASWDSDDFTRIANRLSGIAALSHVPLVFANLAGSLPAQSDKYVLRFAGKSRILDHDGAIVAALPHGVTCGEISAEFDLEELRLERAAGRRDDRRPDLYRTGAGSLTASGIAAR
jgi:N-carbamoylputrescine amidase